MASAHVRIMNGKPRNPHNVEDIGAPRGMMSRRRMMESSASPSISLSPGKGVFVDHGLGFYSMYFHLSEILVKDGDLIKAGRNHRQGGATGRASESTSPLRTEGGPA